MIFPTPRSAQGGRWAIHPHLGMRDPRRIQGVPGAFPPPPEIDSCPGGVAMGICKSERAFWVLIGWEGLAPPRWEGPCLVFPV